MMKKFAFLAVLLMVAASASFAQVSELTLDWSKELAMEGTVSFVAYNFVTDHFLVCQYNADPGKKVAIVDSTGDNIIGYLPETGLTLGSLAVFTICVADDGVIYGGSNPAGATAEEGSLIRWANESATPTEQIFPRYPLDPSGEFVFPRAMDAVGSGADTRIAVSGLDNGEITILTTTDGVNFAITELVLPSPAVPFTTVEDLANVIKADVALVSGDPDTIYGTKIDGSGDLVCLIKTEGSWDADPNFTPPRSFTAVADGGLGGACGVDYAPQQDTVFVLSSRDADGIEDLIAINGTDGSIIDGLIVSIGFNIYDAAAVSGYTSVDVNETAGEGAFGGGGTTRTNAVLGKFSFNPPATPTPIPPTPTASSGVQGFEVYE